MSAAPTDYSFSDHDWKNMVSITPENLYTFIIPSIGNMQTLQGALKEYIGYLIYTLRGWI